MRYQMVIKNGQSVLALIGDDGQRRSVQPIWDDLAAKYGVGHVPGSLDVLLGSQDPVSLADELESKFDFCEPLPDEVLPDIPLRGGDLFCIGRNYAAHARELGNEIPGEPIVFMKPRASLLPGDGEVVVPNECSQIHYEGELALVIGRPLQGAVSPAKARESLFGVTLMNDFTDREKQSVLKQGGKPWLAAKGRPTFAPLGPSVFRLKPGFELESLTLRTYVNDDLKQEGSPKLWLFPLHALMDYLSRVFTLRAGDVVATGTPEGVGGVSPGDRVTVQCDHVGELTVLLTAEDS
jgi:2-keto-4-pentenoate hydratase/2-oxohepta-3-ene-1,7-dioic acid hydratase in catechol pathway